MKNLWMNLRPLPCGAMCWIWPWAWSSAAPSARSPPPLVNDIIMPVVSVLTNGIDFSQWKLVAPGGCGHRRR